MPRLYREAPLQSIWEGSGNVAALDALRALTRQPETAEALFAVSGSNPGAEIRAVSVTSPPAAAVTFTVKVTGGRGVHG